jgi:hypothetical protein
MTRAVPALTLAILLGSLLVAAPGEPVRRLWVLQQPDAIVEYDIATLAPRRTLRVPPRVIEHPEHLTANTHGEIAFLPPAAGNGDPPLAAWVWNGRDAREWSTEALSGRETTRQWFLSAAGASLFVFEQTFEKVLDASSGIERSVRARSRVLRTDLGGRVVEAVAAMSSPGSCTCDTGTCSETCPEWSMWAPDRIVHGAFLVTRRTPGQLTPTYHETAVYRRAGSTWRGTMLPRPLEKPLDASPKADVIVTAIPDGGCCGWENETSDQTLLIRNGASAVLYDEFSRYDNRNYDVSFYAVHARLAPRGTRVALTIVSTAPVGDLRPSSEGQENPAERARLQKTIGDLPAVEVFTVAAPTGTALTLRRTVLVGWISDDAILVAQDGRLVRHDVRSGKRTETSIRIRTAADAVLR